MGSRHRPGLLISQVSKRAGQLTEIFHILENTLYAFSPLAKRRHPATLGLILVLWLEELVRCYPLALGYRLAKFARLLAIRE